MSFLSKVLPVEFTTVAADVEAEAKKIQAKADADIAALRKSRAVTAAVADVDSRLAAFKLIVADYESKLASERHIAAAGATGVTGATGYTGVTGPGPTITTTTQVTSGPSGTTGVISGPST